jgi:hypothetical protein
MTTSSEDVLLQVGQVRYKKGDGTLYVMNERLAWMMDHRDTVSVSHRYTDIKSKLMLFFLVVLLVNLYAEVLLKCGKLFLCAASDA